MTDLIRVENEEDFLSLALKFGIDLEAPDVSLDRGSGGALWTNFTKVEGIREVSQKLWTDSGEFRLLNPDYTDPEDFDPIMPRDITHLTGFIVHVEFQSNLTHYDAPSQTWTNFCSVVGHMNPSTKQLIQALPNIGYSTMYEWDKSANQPNRTKPSPAAVSLGMVGCKKSSAYKDLGIEDVPQKMTCENCIKAGLSSVEVDTKDGPKTKECSPTGRMFLYLTKVAVVKRTLAKGATEPEVKVVKEYTIRELYNEPGILVQLSLPTSLGLRGKGSYKNPDHEKAVGYVSLLNSLKYQFKNHRSKPYFNEITIGLKSFSGIAKKYLDFGYNPIFESAMFEQAQEAWLKVKPESEVRILNIEDFQGVSGSIESPTIPAKAVAVDRSAPPMKSAQVLDDPNDPFF